MSTIFARLLVIAVGVVSGIVTARVLGPEGRGLYYLVITLAASVVQFGNLGFPAWNTYKAARDPGSARSLAMNSVWLSIGVAVAAGFIFAVAPEITNVPSVQVLLAVVLGATSLLFLSASNILVGVRQISSYNSFQVAINAATLAAMLLAAIATGTVTAFLVATLCVNVAFTSILVRRFLLVSDASSFWRPSVSLLRDGLSYSARAYVVSMFGFILLRENVFLIDRLSTSRELGIYSVSAQMADAMAVVPVSVALLLFPRLARQPADGYGHARRQAIWVLASLALATTVLAAVARPIVELAFGVDYGEAADVFVAMVPGIVFLGTATVLSQYLAAASFPPAIYVAWLVAIAAGLGTGLALIPSRGATGAAVSFSISHAVLAVTVWVAASRHARRIARKPAVDQTPPTERSEP